MNFAPYQDESPEIERALSPPPRSRASLEAAQTRSPPPQRPQLHTRLISDVQPLPSPRAVGHNVRASSYLERGQSLEAFETSLSMRLDHEAMLAYLFLPPVGGLFLLLTEHKSDYVRFHAWQSSMLFATMFVIHLLFVWSAIISWLLLACDLVLMGFLAMRAYRDVDNLEHYQVPLFGRWANSFVDDE